MNGVHDMGGMHGLGSINREESEPIFHELWESRVFALTIAIGAFGQWTIDASRHARELIPGPEYLAMSYYERWFTGLISLLNQSGLLAPDEAPLEKSSANTLRAKSPLHAKDVASMLVHGDPKVRAIDKAPHFALGSTVCARNINPVGHTRLPRYVRGKRGRITRLHGTHVFPDTNAHELGEQPQHLYQVRFEALDLWGETQASAVYLDLWESYLESA